MVKRKIFIISVFFIILISTFFVGLFIGAKIDPTEVLPISEGIPADSLEPINKVWEIIHDQYLEQPVNETMLIQGALRGMLESLEDPYSAYMDPAEYKTQSTPLNGEYTGIGAWVDTTGEFLVIMSPMPNSPAEAAGILPNDVVVGIDGNDMTGLDPILVLDKILGPAGSKIKLTISRDGEILEFELERAIIPIPSVESSLLENNVGYLRLFAFGANSPDEVRSALSDLQNQGAERYIIDLRNNSGGFVDSAVEITSSFLEDGTILIEEWGDGTQNEYKATGKVFDTQSPLIILVNEGSASASEIMAGALQDYGRAILVGATTFGKGYIQNWVPLNDDFGAVRITIARWLTPKGRQIQGFGLTPDFLVEISEEDMQNQKDTQFDKALEIIIEEK